MPYYLCAEKSPANLHQCNWKTRYGFVLGYCLDRCLSIRRSDFTYPSSYFYGRYYYQCNHGALYYRSCGLNQSYYPGLGRCGSYINSDNIL